MWPLKSRPAGNGRQRAARSFARRRRWRYVRRGGAAVIVVMLAGLAHYVWQRGTIDQWRSGLRERLGRLAQVSGLTLREVHVMGNRRVAREDIIEALAAPLGSPVLDIDLDAARRRIEALAWVKGAVLHRQFPDSLEIVVREREPFALWQYRGQVRLIDASGAVIVKCDPKDFAGLPLVVGAGADAAAATLIAALSDEPDLARRITAAVRVGERRWDLHFDTGMRLMLPEQDSAAAWRKFAELERRYALLDRDLELVDMRIEDRLVVRLAHPPRRLEAMRQPLDGV